MPANVSVWVSVGNWCMVFDRIPWMTKEPINLHFQKESPATPSLRIASSTSSAEIYGQKAFCATDAIFCMRLLLDSNHAITKVALKRTMIVNM